MRRRRPQLTAAALAWLEARPLEPVLTCLEAQEEKLLRLGGLDDLLTTPVLGRRVPADMLDTPAKRARALVWRVPAGALVYGASAFWVHTGMRPPSSLEVVVARHTASRRGLVVRQGRVPPRDQVTVAGTPCCTLSRASVDVARTARPALAAQVLLVARRRGVAATELHRCVTHCVGAQVRGRDRVDRLIPKIYALDLGP